MYWNGWNPECLKASYTIHICSEVKYEMYDTTIIISKELRDMIKGKKIFARESYEEIIRRCMFNEAAKDVEPYHRGEAKDVEGKPEIVTDWSELKSGEDAVATWWAKYSPFYGRAFLEGMLKSHGLKAPEITEEEAVATQKDEGEFGPEFEIPGEDGPSVPV